MTERKRNNNLTEQVENKVKNGSKDDAAIYEPYEGNFNNMISTGSTQLDLAISGGRIRGGGIPSGILVEIAGPSGSGKTVMLSELGGDVQRKKGDAIFFDPEFRLNKQFAAMFGLDIENISYDTPDTVTSMFQSIRNWQPKNDDVVNGIFADSLAALSTNLEMENEEGDKMGMRRAKEFSEQLRKTCRILARNNYLMVASNQVRETGNQFGPKYRSPGGQAIGFYASLRLQTHNPEKITEERHIAGKKVKRVIGVKATVEVSKNSVWSPYRTAPLTIIFDYGIDNIRDNLQFIKDYTTNTVYTIGGRTLDKSMDKSIGIVEEEGLENQLHEEVVDLWEGIESKFKQNRKTKKR